jgi:hypothetical protein
VSSGNGRGIGTRTLYTGTEETTFNAKRPMILNGINDPAVRPDLLSRTIQISLPSIPVYRTESEIDEQFVAVHPQVLGALSDFVVAALANRDTVKTASSRMADFEQWITAAEHNPNRPDWWQLGDFSLAYCASLDSGDAIALAENAVIVEPLKMLIATSTAKTRFHPDKPVWSGSPTDLLRTLATLANKEPRDLANKGNPSAFSRRLNRLTPSLATIGIKIVNHKNPVILRFTRAAYPTVGRIVTTLNRIAVRLNHRPESKTSIPVTILKTICISTNYTH